MVVIVFSPCGIVRELSPEIDIFCAEPSLPPEEDDELEEEPPEDDELEDKSPEEDDELEEEPPEEDDELEEEPLEEDDELEEEPPEEDELDDELLELEDDDELTQSAKPAQVPPFVGQQPLIQQRGPHCVYAQPAGP